VPASIVERPVTVRFYVPVTVRSRFGLCGFFVARPGLARPIAGNGGSCPRSDPVTVRFYFSTPCRAGLDRRASGDGAFLFGLCRFRPCPAGRVLRGTAVVNHQT